MRKLAGQFVRFGLVGLVGFVIDVAVFNLLRATILSPDVIHEGPVYAKIISSSLAIIANWLGNRFWTFRAHRGRQLWREGIEFAIVSIGGMLIALACLWVSHYLLHFDTVFADNVANLIGLALGTIFRFTFYRIWVFAPRRGEAAPSPFPARSEDGPTELAAAESDEITPALAE